MFDGKRTIVLSEHPETLMPIPIPNRRLLTQSVSVLCLATAPLWLYVLLFPEHDFAAGLVVFVVVLIADAGLILHFTRHDEELRKIMTAGLFLKLFAAAVYLAMMIYYYEGGDALFYVQQGANISHSLMNNGEIGFIEGAGA